MALANTLPQFVSTSQNRLRRWNQMVDHFRVQNHLRLVEKRLRRQDVSHLPVKLQVRRAQHLDHLHQYWLRGLFPLNIHFPGQRVPYFQDHLGTQCAMAYLIAKSGQTDLVAAVQSTNNNIYINDITGGPVLAWIHQSGLTQAEAAQIQPTYGFEDPPYNTDPCGFSGCPDTPAVTALQFIPWIFGGVTLIALEWLSYTIVSWLPLYNIPRKVIVWFYLTAYNLLIAFGLGLMLWITIDKITNLSW